MKTYVLTVSRVFPATHNKRGEQTYFIERISPIFCKAYSNCEHNDCPHCEYVVNPKIHTIRANFPLWEKRIKEVQAGKAILSIRYWSGKPYNSTQVEICQLDKDFGIGIQKLKLNEFVDLFIDETQHNFSTVRQLAQNDGLLFEDFLEWFKKYDFSKPMAIIHFTKFRYS